jgi:hypothetical protein
MPSATLAPTSSAPSSNTAPAAPPPRATDDEILGITTPRKTPTRDAAQLEFDFDATEAATNADALRTAGTFSDALAARPAPLTSAQNENSNAPVAQASNARATSLPEPAHLRATFDANPELRAAALLADVNHMDALFFSRRPEDHASLARAIANLDPAAFTSLANAMQTIAAGSAHAPAAPPVAQASADRRPMEMTPVPPETANNAHADGLRTAGVSPAPLISSPHAQSTADSATANESQLAFLHAANAAAVEGVVAAIEAQVARLLPEGVAKNARTRVVGEIYRELDSSLRSNPQFAAQLRDAFRSGSLDDGHQRAIVSLLTGRARQALPGVAKRVLSEWTSTIVSAANERRTRQRTAERRIDIAGSSGAGNDGRRSMSPRDLDYARLTDADILNL